MSLIWVERRYFEANPSAWAYISVPENSSAGWFLPKITCCLPGVLDGQSQTDIYLYTGSYSHNKQYSKLTKRALTAYKMPRGKLGFSFQAHSTFQPLCWNTAKPHLQSTLFVDVSKEHWCRTARFYPLPTNGVIIHHTPSSAFRPIFSSSLLTLDTQVRREGDLLLTGGMS